MHSGLAATRRGARTLVGAMRLKSAPFTSRRRSSLRGSPGRSWVNELRQVRSKRLVMGWLRVARTVPMVRSGRPFDPVECETPGRAPPGGCGNRAPWRAERPLQHSRARFRAPMSYPFSIAALALLLASCNTNAPRTIAVYSGPYTDNSLPEEIALFQPLSFEDAQLVAVAYAETLAQPSESVRWELEGNVVKWFGDQDHVELNGLVMLRWLTPPWERWIDSSVGFGNGLSLASENPELEAFFHPDTGTRRLLYHIAIDVGFTLPWAPDWETFVRVHHRSGVFGTFGGVDGGSNVLALGLRLTL
jgi:hypothetical protein